MNWKEMEAMKIPIHLNKRIKLTRDQKTKIRAEYKLTETSYNALARKYGVSKRTIIFAVNPEKYEKAKLQRRKRWADGNYKNDPKLHRENIADLRRRKKLFIKTQENA